MDISCSFFVAIFKMLSLGIDDIFLFLSIQHAYNPDEDYTEVEAKLRAHLESFLETARSFNTIYTKVVSLIQSFACFL